ncbi:MAG: NUDIX domain-containing protein [Paludibacteraceae bacterium]|nr:NUDIX domain-containing protein [Paludibacteraceae bacterium]
MNFQHPLHYFGYCPHCGSPLFSEDGPRSKRCGNCGFTFYLNPAAAAAALITNGKGQLLLTRRAFEPKKGTLDLPGGFAELDETLEEAIRREIREELNAELVNLQFFCSAPNRYPFSGLIVHTLDCFFTAQLADGTTLVSGDDVDSYVWLAPEEIDVEQIGLDSIRNTVAKWKAQMLG